MSVDHRRLARRRADRRKAAATSFLLVWHALAWTIVVVGGILLALGVR